MLVTLLGIVILVMLLARKSKSPIPVTGRPLIVLGIATTSLVPVYPVTVTAPFVTV